MRIGRIVVAFGLSLAGAGTVAAQTQCGTYSTLQNIDCGGGQSTCTDSLTATSGSVRCSCFANCALAQSIVSSVAATSGVSWGVGSACLTALTGNASGGTTNGPGSVWTTSVFATSTLTGLYVFVVPVEYPAGGLL